MEITIYIDGACMPNPGRGGWGVVLHKDDETLEMSGYEEHTTNQRMEVTAAINSLKYTKEGDVVTIYSDSQYLIKTMTSNWRRNTNKDLWQDLDALVVDREIKWCWVRGHDGNPGNEKADELAVDARVEKRSLVLVYPRYGK